MGFETIDAAVNHAAKELPVGCKVIISIEKDGYGVEVEIPSGANSTQIMGLGENSIIDDIVVGTDMAKDLYEAIS